MVPDGIEDDLEELGNVLEEECRHAARDLAKNQNGGVTLRVAAVKLAAADSGSRSAGAAAGSWSSAGGLQDFEGSFDLMGDQLELQVGRVGSGNLKNQV